MCFPTPPETTIEPLEIEPDNILQLSTDPILVVARSIDIGQIEGGFVQGMGWLTTEELVYDDKGRLLTHAPSTYKIPVASDVPKDFRVALFAGSNREDTIYHSKAVGEPPLMLGISVFAAIADAVHSVNPGKPVALDAPATPEAILKAVGPVDAVAALAPLVGR